MLAIFVFVAVFVFVTPYRGDTSDVDEYVDEVLFEHLPRMVKNANLDISEVQDFYFNGQDNLAEPEAFDGSVKFLSGNLTGLSAAHRRSCRSSSRISSDIKIICNVILPRVSLRYRGRYEATAGLTSSYGDRVLQRDFYGEILFRDFEAQIEITKLNDREEPSITNLLLLGEGEAVKRFLYNDVTRNRLFNQFYVPFHEISRPFHQKCVHLFQQIFYGSYSEVLEKAFSTVEYPERY